MEPSDVPGEQIPLNAYYLEHLFDMLDISSRTAAVVYAVHHDLV